MEPKGRHPLGARAAISPGSPIFSSQIELKLFGFPCRREQSRPVSGSHSVYIHARALWGLTRNLRKPRNTAKCLPTPSLQNALCPAVELIAGMAANDFGRRFQRTNRLVGMCDKVNWRTNRMLRHGRPTVPRCKSSISRSGNLEGLAFLIIPICKELTGCFSKLPPLRICDLGRKHDCDVLHRA
jgi:hypothetical protein